MSTGFVSIVNVKNYKVLENVKVTRDSKTGKHVILVQPQSTTSQEVQLAQNILNNDQTFAKDANLTSSSDIEHNFRLPDNIFEQDDIPGDDLMQYILSAEDNHNANIQCTLMNGSKLPEHPDNQQKKREQFFADLKSAVKFDISGNLPFHTSVIKSKLNNLKRFRLIAKAIGQDVNVLNLPKLSGLHLAVLHGASKTIVDYLIREGADLSLTDPSGNTAIHLAIENKQYELLEYLLNIALQMGFNLTVFNFDGFTPLIMAVLANDFEAVELLLRFHADPNVGDLKSGRTALFHAVEQENVYLVELLVDYKARVNIKNFVGTDIKDALHEIASVPIKIKNLILGTNEIEFIPKRKYKEDNKSKKKLGKRKRTN